MPENSTPTFQPAGQPTLAAAALQTQTPTVQIAVKLTPTSRAEFPPICSQAGQQWISPRDGMVLMCVPRGEFIMGSNESDAQAGSDEKPQHRVYLDAYWIDRTEVTNVMFAACVTAGACHPRKYTPYQWGVSSRTRDDYFNNPAYDDYPVIMLDGDEAQAYCHWVGRHLPTEAEWEKAARGTDGRQYPWGEGIDCQQANYLGCLGDTARVGSLLAGASPYGVLDMAGNLWEWTADWYDAGYYQRSPARNPTGPAEGNYRTLRGGSWGSTAYALHSTNRADGKPEHWADGELGFRCAISE